MTHPMDQTDEQYAVAEVRDFVAEAIDALEALGRILAGTGDRHDARRVREHIDGHGALVFALKADWGLLFRHAEEAAP